MNKYQNYLIDKFNISQKLPINVYPISYSDKSCSEYTKTQLTEDYWYHYFGDLDFIPIYNYEFHFLEVGPSIDELYAKTLCRNLSNALRKDPISLSARYLKERIKWQKAGSPIRPDSEKQRIFSICEQCPNFNRLTEKSGECDLCGCGLKSEGDSFNKIAWATTNCPDTPPKWEEDPNIL